MNRFIGQRWMAIAVVVALTILYLPTRAIAQPAQTSKMRFGLYAFTGYYAGEGGWTTGVVEPYMRVRGNNTILIVTGADAPIADLLAGVQAFKAAGVEVIFNIEPFILGPQPKGRGVGQFFPKRAIGESVSPSAVAPIQEDGGKGAARFIASFVKAMASGGDGGATYYVADEPGGQKRFGTPIVPEYVRNATAAVHAGDPTAKTLGVLAPGKFPYDQDAVQGVITPWLGTTDMIGADPYPYGNPNKKTNSVAWITTVFSGIAAAQRAAGTNEPVVYVQQYYQRNKEVGFPTAQVIEEYVRAAVAANPNIVMVLGWKWGQFGHNTPDPRKDAEIYQNTWGAALKALAAVR